MAVLAWGHSSFCKEPKVDIYPGSGIFFGKEGMMIYYQVTVFWSLYFYICNPTGNITDRALPVSGKCPLTPLLPELSLKGKVKAQNRATGCHWGPR